jgi:hypothetical protein
MGESFANTPELVPKKGARLLFALFGPKHSCQFFTLVQGAGSQDEISKQSLRGARGKGNGFSVKLNLKPTDKSYFEHNFSLILNRITF